MTTDRKSEPWTLRLRWGYWADGKDGEPSRQCHQCWQSCKQQCEDTAASPDASSFAVTSVGSPERGMASGVQGMRALMACQEQCWLCEEYEDPSVEGTAMSLCTWSISAGHAFEKYMVMAI